MPLSRKLVTSLITGALTLAAGYAVTRLGLGINGATAGYISSTIALASGAIAGWIVKEVPGL